MCSAAARHAATGEFAALSQLLTDPHAPGWGYQLMTAVTAPHRGHRLGLLVKAATHQWLVDTEPGVRRVVTSNSETNRHMIAINDALGYRPAGLAAVLGGEHPRVPGLPPEQPRLVGVLGGVGPGTLARSRPGSGGQS